MTVFVHKKCDENKLISEKISKILSTFENFPKSVCFAHAPKKKKESSECYQVNGGDLAGLAAKLLVETQDVFSDVW